MHKETPIAFILIGSVLRSLQPTVLFALAGDVKETRFQYPFLNDNRRVATTDTGVVHDAL
jgi:hypothetical protein